MKNPRNVTTDIIMREYKMNKKYQNLKEKKETLAQFELNHCRPCKNKCTNLCEIRKDINGNYRCIYEER